MDEFEEEGLLAAEAESETTLRRPPLYKVLLHNDNFTSMEFVVFILQSIFGRSESDAIQIMLKVHHEGVGIAGLFTFEIAEMKVEKVTALARANEFPLLCTMEEVADDAPTDRRKHRE
jgi:ATP-dependent Clp protease adaptor protein ClpS